MDFGKVSLAEQETFVLGTEIKKILFSCFSAQTSFIISRYIMKAVLLFSALLAGLSNIHHNILRWKMNVVSCQIIYYIKLNIFFVYF